MNGDQREALVQHEASGQILRDKLCSSPTRAAKADRITPFDEIQKHMITQQQQVREMTEFVRDKCDYLMGCVPQPETRGEDMGPPPGRVDQIEYTLQQTDRLIHELREEVQRLNGIA